MADDGQRNYDVVVVGGGAAGLSGALMLARARRSVLVIDAGEPRNAPASGVHGFMSRDGVPPAELSRIARSEVRSYGGHIVDGWARSGAPEGDGFVVTLDGGSAVHGRRLLVTTGLVDELPDVPGLGERWGRDVLHCPYCHGWEIGDRPLGVLATMPSAVQKALLFRQWTPDVTLLLHTQAEPEPDQAEQLAARDIRTAAGEVVGLEVVADRLTGVRLRDGRVVPLRALAVSPRFTARAGFLATLGLDPTPHPMGIGEFVAGDPTGLTAVPGVWVAGNVADLMLQVLGAAAAGAAADVAINADLVSDDTSRAVEGRRPSPLAAPAFDSSPQN